MRQLGGFSKSVLLPFDGVANTNDLGSQAPKLKWCKTCLGMQVCPKQGCSPGLLLWHGRWEPRWAAVCEVLKKAAGVHWRSSVVKIPHSSPDLFKGVVESSCQLAKPVLMPQQSSPPLCLSAACFIHSYWGSQQAASASVATAVSSCRMCMKIPSEL